MKRAMRSFEQHRGPRVQLRQTSLGADVCERERSCVPASFLVRSNYLPSPDQERNDFQNRRWEATSPVRENIWRSFGSFITHCVSRVHAAPICARANPIECVVQQFADHAMLEEDDAAKESTLFSFNFLRRADTR